MHFVLATLALLGTSLWASSLFVSAQVNETPNNECGGVFHFGSSINFTFIQGFTYNANEVNKTCVWTITPKTQYKRYMFKLEAHSLSCINSEIAVTAFKENNAQETNPVTFCNAGSTQIVEGMAIVVILVSKNPGSDINKNFHLSWSPIPGDDPVTDRYRYVTAYNSYGLTNHGSFPYITYFTGNSLATLAFPKGNSTEGYVMRMEIDNVKLHHDPLYNRHICPPGHPNTTYPDCEFLQVYNIQGDGSLAAQDKFEESTTDIEPITSKFGIFMIMWGGSMFNATGGGSIQLEYNFVRG